MHQSVITTCLWEMKYVDLLKSTFLYCWLTILSIIISTEKNDHFLFYKWTNQWWKKSHKNLKIFKIKVMSCTITLEDSLTFTYKTKPNLNHTIQQSHSLLFSQMNWKHTHTKTCTPMFIAALFLIAKTSQVKNLPANAGDIRDVGSIPGLGKSPGGEHACNPLQYSCPDNSIDRGAWWATVHKVASVHTKCWK